MRRRASRHYGLGSALFGSACVFTTLAGTATAQEESASDEPLEEIIVTGYRKSLEDAASAKRESTNFTDSVFAEDIGKFPDLNIAESLNRIPGIQLTREINGEGLNIAIRGLGTNFTKVMLNGAQIAVASTGPTDATNQNRELDLDLFPTELFTRLDVSKSPRASMTEGGVSGVVNMRSARPFDTPGNSISFQLQGGYGEISDKLSPRGSITASWKNDTFGVLAGAAAVRNKSTTLGYETIGWTNPTITHGMCGTTPGANQTLASVSGACNTTVGNGWAQPGVNTNANSGPITGIGSVPAGVGNGLVPGTPINRAFLEANNPGLSLEQIGNALIPRLSRPSYSSGNRDRIAGLVSFEFRPRDDLQFYLDTLYADASRSFDRLDMNLVGRNGGIIPLNLQLDENNVVTQGTFANAQFFLEARPYDEEVNFYNLNPGVHYDFREWLGVDFQVNKTRSKFFREAPSILVNTPLGQGVTVQYENTGGNFPTVAANVDLNNPNLGWTWGPGSRVNIQNERRDTETQGARLDLRFGEPDLNVTVGGAYDDVERTILALDASRQWQQAVCGGGGAFIPAPLPQPACNGQAGSVIPTSALGSYLLPGPAGFITMDFDRFFRDTGYQALSDTAPVATGSATSARTGGVAERTTGAYVELNGSRNVWNRMLRANLGVRYITTDQTISGPVTVGGIVQPNWVSDLTTYNKYLPAFNAAYNITDNILARAAASRTLTRPDPSAMIPAIQFTDVGAVNANVGNPGLSPFISDNIDLGGEWYTGEEGFVGLTLFRKRITGFTVNQTTVVPFAALNIPFITLTPDQQNALNGRGGPGVATVNLQQQVNAEGLLTIKGYEVTWVQPLRRFTDVLDGFGYNLNYTRVTQKGEGRGAPAQAIGISPHAYNATAYYEKHDASVRLSYVWNDDQISSQLNEQGIPLAQRFTDSYGQWDLSASYEFTALPTSPQITLNVINITSQAARSTFQFPNATFTYYDPGYQVLLGVRGTF